MASHNLFKHFSFVLYIDYFEYISIINNIAINTEHPSLSPTRVPKRLETAQALGVHSPPATKLLPILPAPPHLFFS